MKYFILLITLWFQFSLSAQSIDPAPQDKAVVYFVRASSLGALINFTYFDSTSVIGRFNGPKFLRYECKPGEHLFWARSENRDFVKANLEAGKIYVIDVIPQMGAVKAAVKLRPINSANYKMKRIQKLLAKRVSESFTEEELESLQSQMAEVVERGMEKLSKDGLSKSLNGFTFSPLDLTYVKKKE